MGKVDGKDLTRRATPSDFSISRFGLAPAELLALRRDETDRPKGGEKHWYRTLLETDPGSYCHTCS